MVKLWSVDFLDALKSRYQKLVEVKVIISSQYAHKSLIKAKPMPIVIPLIQVKQQKGRLVSMVHPCVLTGAQSGV